MTNDIAVERLLDPKFYLESFVKIKAKTPGLQPFLLNEAQKDLFNALNTHSRVIILKARQIGFCLDKNTKILSSDLKWIRIDDIKVGQELVSVDENSLTRGKGSSRKMRTSIVEGKWEVEEEAYRIVMEDGRVLIATGKHRFMSKKKAHTDVCWRKVEEMVIGSEIRYIVKPWGDTSVEDAWFGGLIDGEGSLRYKNHSGAEICVVQNTDGIIWDEMKKYAESNGYNFCIELDNRPYTQSGKFSNKQCGKVVMNRMDEVFRLVGQTRPKRFLGKKWWEGKELPGKCSGIGWSKIKSIESIGTRKMIDLQTSTKTFIAEGFVSHNSTAVTGFLYHKTITTPGTNTALIGYNSDLTAELLDKVKTFYRTTPDSIRPQIQYNSKYEISFPAIDSKILVLPSSENVGRGYTLHNVLCTELAFWEKAEEKMLAIENSVPQNGKIIIESTPNAIGNLYHRMWMAENGYCKKEYGWWWHYTEEEIEIIRRRINNPMRFAQEYGLEFLSSGRPVFSSDLIKRLRKGVYKIGQHVKDREGIESIVTQNEDGLIMYHQPHADKTYVLGADVSEGVTGGDYSVFTIFDRKTGEEVAFWRGYLTADRFGAVINKSGRLYNNALAVIEINNHGLTTVTALRNLMYPQLYFRPVTQMDMMGVRFSDRMGWKTTKVTRPLMIDDLREALAENSLTLHTEKTLDEMLTFVFDDGGNMVTQSSFHDDGIMATAIALQGFKVLAGGKLDQIDYEQILPESSSY
jgi:hypothetical protein